MIKRGHTVCLNSHLAHDARHPKSRYKHWGMAYCTSLCFPTLLLSLFIVLSLFRSLVGRWLRHLSYATCVKRLTSWVVISPIPGAGHQVAKAGSIPGSRPGFRPVSDPICQSNYRLLQNSKGFSPFVHEYSGVVDGKSEARLLLAPTAFSPCSAFLLDEQLDPSAARESQSMWPNST